MEKLLTSSDAAAAIGRYGRDPLKRALTEEIAAIRRGEVELASDDALIARAAEKLAASTAPSLRRVLNGSGVIIHTNLGRSPISREIFEEASEVIASYSNLEFDIARGERGSRSGHLTSVCRELFGCEAALLTNNNAGATLLLLAAIAAGKEVLVSRGELVEIGGGFRVPDVIQQGGARLREVGTTNRTRARDYAEAKSESTTAILRVHRSNFDIVGFTEQPALEEMVEVARQSKVPLLYDEGSGRVVDIASYGFRPEPTIREVVATGVDVVTCSTDKLIGATQGGLILGRAEIVERCAKHPLMRALRAGKESYAIVGATLRAFAAAKHERVIPIYRMLAQPLEALRERATRLASAIGADAIETRAAIGGGTTPNETMPSWGIAMAGAAEEIHRRMLDGSPAVVGRIEEGRYILDLRSIDESDDEVVAGALQRVVR